MSFNCAVLEVLRSHPLCVVPANIISCRLCTVLTLSRNDVLKVSYEVLVPSDSQPILLLVFPSLRVAVRLPFFHLAVCLSFFVFPPHARASLVCLHCAVPFESSRVHSGSCSCYRIVRLCYRTRAPMRIMTRPTPSSPKSICPVQCYHRRGPNCRGSWIETAKY